MKRFTVLASTGRTNKRRIVASAVYEMPEYDFVMDQYLPDQGEGDTFATQIATAVNKLVYKWYNDGDVYDNNYGMDGFANDLSSFANWLYKYVPNTRKILEQIYRCYTEDQYERILAHLVEACLDEETMSKDDKQPKQGSIFNASGPFSFNEYLYENAEDEYY